MRKILLLLLLLGLIPTELRAQDITTTTCTSANKTGCVEYPVAGQATIGIQVSGTFSGTITFSVSVNNTTFSTLTVFPPNSTTGVTTTTSTGMWAANVAGYGTVRVAFTSWVSGTATVSRITTTARGGSVSGGGGSGGGTPGGSDTQVQFNDGGLFGGDAGLVFNKTTNVLTGVSFITEAPTQATVNYRLNNTAAGTDHYSTLNVDDDGSFTINADFDGDGAVFQYSTSQDKWLASGTLEALTALAAPKTTSDYVANGSSPTVDDTSGGNSCGSSGNPSMVANSVDNAWSFNVGTGGGSDCTITFATTAPHRWVCSVTNETTGNLVRASAGTATTIKVLGVLTAADVISGVCFAR